jgi:hypothetical protein
MGVAPTGGVGRWPLTVPHEHPGSAAQGRRPDLRLAQPLAGRFSELTGREAYIAMRSRERRGALLAAERAAPHTPAGRTAAGLLGPLAGWLTVASFANLDATLSARSVRRPSMARTYGLLGAASAAAAGLTVASRGNLGNTGAATWGLGGIAVRARRDHNRALAVAAAPGVLTVTATTFVGRQHRR